MNTARSSHVNRLRHVAGEIFGPGFEQKWFATKFNRGNIGMLQVLSGAYVGPMGKGYRLFAPILFPGGSAKRSKDIFLNPALAKVSVLFFSPLHGLLISRRY